MASVAEIDYSEATDTWLLSRYRRKRDQQAFSQLVHRYHALVLGVAQRMLGCSHSAEDVLQATFLVLAKDAHKIRNRQALASWLYGVAFRISIRLAKRRARQPVQLLEEDKAMVADDPLEKLSQQFEQQTTFEELHRLPESLRSAMVLRYLQGKSNAQVAETLNLSESAVEGRLKRGRHQLRLRLARQGVAFAAAITVLENTKKYAVAAHDTELVTRTIETCLTKPNTTDVRTGDSIQLANEEMLKMATTAVLKNVAVGLVSVTIVAAGWSLATNADLRAQEGSGEVVIQNQPAGASKPQTSTRIQGTPQSRYFSGEPAPSARAWWGYSSPQPAASTSSRPNAGIYSLEAYGESERAILKALKDKTTVEFQEEALGNVMAVLEEDHSIQIVLDQQAMVDENVDPNDTITVDVGNIRLESALNHILEPLNLTWVLKDEVLMITSREREEELVVPRVYRTNSDWGVPREELINVITSTVSPHSWDDVGGPGHITAISGGGLVISNSAKVHAQINELLRQIDRLKSSR